jgi:signal transduction histidine kinase
MSPFKRIGSRLENLAHIEHPDPVQERRSQLLGILLLGAVTVALMLLLVSVVFNLGRLWDADVLRRVGASLAYLVLAGILLAANRAGHIRSAAVAFLAALTIFVFLGDTPQHVVGGRTTFLFTLPIFLAGVLLSPSASVVFAVLISLGIYGMSRYYALELVFAPSTVLGFFVVALVGWLAASSLEDALITQARQAEELRRMNEELDQRVDERTAELAMANERLKELDRMRTEFLSTAAHELRTPLTVIVGFSELLVTRRAMSGNEQYRFIEMIHQNAARLSAIVGDLVDLSRIEAGKEIEVNVQPMDLYPVVEELVTVFRAHSATHSYRIERRDRWAAVTGDPDKLRQVINNLLANATKYSPGGGRVTVQARPVDRFLQVSIQDEGIGMTPDQQAHLFEPFYRADASNTAVGGTGLGLAICQAIVARHGGEIWVDSQTEAGTAVHFTLPLAKEVPLQTEMFASHDLADPE